jgi:hypothetical protein
MEEDAVETYFRTLQKRWIVGKEKNNESRIRRGTESVESGVLSVRYRFLIWSIASWHLVVVWQVGYSISEEYTSSISRVTYDMA